MSQPQQSICGVPPSSLLDETTDWLFFSALLGLSLIINLAQLVSPSVALPAELVDLSIQQPRPRPLDQPYQSEYILMSVLQKGLGSQLT